MNVPNTISALRFAFAALFPFTGDPLIRIAVLSASAASDWIDGRMARDTGQVTRLGELLDPIADKTFMLVVLVTLAVEDLLPLWTLPLLLLRDAGVAVGALAIAIRGTRVRMPARRAGKIVTWLQFFGIGLILLVPQSALWIAPAVGAASVIALVDYARAAGVAFTRSPAPPHPRARPR